MVAIRHNCNEDGCFMECRHPKMEDFDGPFGTNPPRDIKWSDIDSTVEVDGYFCFVEYKSHYDMADAQRKYYERLTKLDKGERVVVFYVVGDGAKRVAEEYQECINGVWGDWVSCDWHSLGVKLQAFRREAEQRRRDKANETRRRRESASSPAVTLASGLASWNVSRLSRCKSGPDCKSVVQACAGS